MFAQPQKGDQHSNRGHEVEQGGGCSHREAPDGDAPQDESNGRGHQPEVDGGQPRAGAGGRHGPPAPGQQRQDEDCPGEHRVGGHFEARVAAQQGLAQGVVEALGDGRGGDQGNRAGEADPGAGQADHRHTCERHQAAERPRDGEALAEKQAGNGQADQGGGRDHEACGAGRHAAFGLVEQQLVGGHAEETGGHDQREIPPVRAAGPGPSRQHHERGGGHGQPGQRQSNGPEGGRRHPDRGEGAGPQDHDADAGGEASGAGHARTLREN